MSETNVQRLKRLLREARQRQALSQGDLARRLGVRQQMVAKLESPSYEPSLSQFERTAAALGFSLNVTLRRKRK